MAEEPDKIAVMPWVRREAVGYGEPDADMVETLESLTERARTGEIRAMAWSAVTSERSLITNWSGHCDVNDMTAAIAGLQFRFMSAKVSDDG